VFVVQAANEAAKGKREAGIAGFQMSSGVLQKIILLERCVVVTAKAVLEFCQLPSQGIDCLRWKEMAKALQKIAHFFTIDADRVDHWVRSFRSDRFADFANAAKAFQDSLSGNFEDRTRGIWCGIHRVSRSPCILKRGDVVSVGIGAKKLRNPRRFEVALSFEFLEERIEPASNFLGQHVFKTTAREKVNIVIPKGVCSAAKVSDLFLPCFGEVLGKNAFHLAGHRAEFAERDAIVVEKFRVDILDYAFLIPAGDREQAAEDFQQDGAGVCLGSKGEPQFQ